MLLLLLLSSAAVAAKLPQGQNPATASSTTTKGPADSISVDEAYYTSLLRNSCIRNNKPDACKDVLAKLSENLSKTAREQAELLGLVTDPALLQLEGPGQVCWGIGACVEGCAAAGTHICHMCQT